MAGARRQILRGPQLEIFARSARRARRHRHGAPGWGRAARFRAGIPNAIGQGGARLRDFVAQAAQFLVFRSLQPADLLLHRANAGHLPDIGGNAPEQQVARHIEGARGQVALVGVRLHLLGARQALAQGGERQVLHLGVGGQQRLAGALIVRGGLAGEFGRRDESGASKNPGSATISPARPRAARLRSPWRPARRCLQSTSRCGPGRRWRRGRTGSRSSPEIFRESCVRTHSMESRMESGDRL